MKALKFLKHMKQTDTPYNFRECEINEAISELEEAMKPKSCDSCRSKLCSVKRILLERGEINSSYFYCNDYEPKDNA